METYTLRVRGSRQDSESYQKDQEGGDAHKGDEQ